MTTTAIASTRKPDIIMPGTKQKSTREIVREEIKREKKLEELEEKYQAGEISDFEYKAGKFFLTNTIISDDNEPILAKGNSETAGKCFSTTA